MSRVRVPSLTPKVGRLLVLAVECAEAQTSEPLLPALSAAVQPNGKNHGSHQDDHPDADCGKAGSPEGRPDSAE